ncbi:hypothetical protein GLOIN_2v1530783 [Rhizophagus irregularis DAOM 181602=DAOM 197198]|uniref:Uncharacterized protein n=1 Tax=Rhizophagus irregularis (strain DAOM 181602 / DAOM 197198 / MUCL 43194) TaxID=747089 RepID=A0A2P4QNL5_RHIID|nr:hypothetical protein GLOIN_2v1530783 [Rhizophagus irregularis DAOM 181602=DAOM 197198]POG79158.1 hypothetical protein GLOIN_2v1530783 [Rhizophagus irregularis DAOM 181602=DAOM 197198]|eukprot:XP_025186024.1 hypothetical protein GLOIN_2v1530783 [Rhizophagus irregularis DAOM 181602=DAOM 197198]
MFLKRLKNGYDHKKKSSYQYIILSIVYIYIYIHVLIFIIGIAFAGHVVVVVLYISGEPLISLISRKYFLKKLLYYFLIIFNDIYFIHNKN